MPQHIVTETMDQYAHRKATWTMIRWGLMILGIIFVIGGFSEFNFKYIIGGIIAFLLGFFLTKGEWTRARQRKARDLLP